MDGIALDTDRVVWDDNAPGLGLRVQAGKRSWIVRYRVAGVQRQKSLDGHLKLARARSEASEIRTSAKRGADIIAEGRAKAEVAKREADAARARSLGTIVERYLPDAKKRLRPASFKVARLYLTGERYWQQLRNRPADALGRREILTVLEPWDGRITAAQMLAHLSACLTWGVERGLLERNPATGIRPPVEKVARERVLSDDELRAVWNAAGDDTFGRIIKLLVLTGQRRGEVGGLRRAELDFDREVWSLPGARTKNKLPHDIPLSRQVKAILAQQDGDPLFGGRNGFWKWRQSKVELDAKLSLPPWTLHDLRRSAITHMCEIGISPHIVEAVVNHVSGHKGGVAGVYNKAKYSAEKRAALQRWADHVERLVSGQPASNVVAMAR